MFLLIYLRVDWMLICFNSFLMVWRFLFGDFIICVVIVCLKWCGFIVKWYFLDRCWKNVCNGYWFIFNGYLLWWCKLNCLILNNWFCGFVLVFSVLLISSFNCGNSVDIIGIWCFLWFLEFVIFSLIFCLFKLMLYNCRCSSWFCCILV